MRTDSRGFATSRSCTRAVLTLLLICALPSCNRAPVDVLVGEWRGVPEPSRDIGPLLEELGVGRSSFAGTIPARLQFYKDGTFTDGAEPGKIGTYKSVDAEHVRLEMGSDASIVRLGVISHDEVVFTRPDGTQLHLRRITRQRA